MKCPECGGTGEVEKLTNYGGYIYEGVQDCPCCGGRGILTRKTQIWLANHEDLPYELQRELMIQFESEIP